jgi:chromosome segregation ATPase
MIRAGRRVAVMARRRKAGSSTISQLSGGEKALTAVALVFRSSI